MKIDFVFGSNLREGESFGSNGVQKDSLKIQVMVQQFVIWLNYKVLIYIIDVEFNRFGFFWGEVVWCKELFVFEQFICVGGVFGEVQVIEQLVVKVYEWFGQ